MKAEVEIFETRMMKNGWEAYTGRFRGRLVDGDIKIYFELPGRGGRVTKNAAKIIRELWDDGIPAGEIASRTDCRIVGY